MANETIDAIVEKISGLTAMELADLSKADLWERFLFEPFQRRHSGYLSKDK